VSEIGNPTDPTTVVKRIKERGYRIVRIRPDVHSLDPNLRLIDLEKAVTATATLADGAHVLLHGPLADLDAELQELAPDPFGPPKSVFGRHFPDQANGLGGDPAVDASGLGSPTPEHAKPLAMPPQDGLGLHNGQGAAPRGQHRGCEQEAKPVKRGEPRMRRLPAQDHDLVPEHRVLDDEFPSTSNNVGRHSARDARPAVGGDRSPDGAGSRPDQSTM